MGHSRGGRRPTPTGKKLVTGNPGHRPLNENEPKPEPALPDPPAHLSDGARRRWRSLAPELHAIGVLSKIDADALASYCTAYARWEEAETLLGQAAEADPKHRGLLIQTTNGNFIQNPLVGVANKAMREMLRYQTEFGMTPSARSRIDREKAGGEGGATDPARQYF